MSIPTAESSLLKYKNEKRTMIVILPVSSKEMINNYLRPFYYPYCIRYDFSSEQSLTIRTSENKCVRYFAYRGPATDIVKSKVTINISADDGYYQIDGVKHLPDDDMWDTKILILNPYLEFSHSTGLWIFRVHALIPDDFPCIFFWETDLSVEKSYTQRRWQPDTQTIMKSCLALSCMNVVNDEELDKLFLESDERDPAIVFPPLNEDDPFFRVTFTFPKINKPFYRKIHFDYSRAESEKIPLSFRLSLRQLMYSNVDITFFGKTIKNPGPYKIGYLSEDVIGFDSLLSEVLDFVMEYIEDEDGIITVKTVSLAENK